MSSEMGIAGVLVVGIAHPRGLIVRRSQKCGPFDLPPQIHATVDFGLPIRCVG